ncbi:MAG TPA: hypothetical protein VES36_09515, partial [Candidatus Limnocylindrales bacterium]|nr:hypothetical protein [Candidatus Limnocylindrales bacterium]
MTRLAPLPLYPITFALCWVLAAVIDSGVRLQTAVRVLLVVPLTAAVLVVACALVLKSRQRAGVAAAALVVLLSSRDFSRLGLAVIGIVASVLAILLIRRIVRRPIGADQLTGAANVISAVLLATIIVQGLANGSLPAWIGDLVEQPPAVAASDQDLPDIYVILVDGYPRDDTVREVLGGDNAPFLERLEARGFTIDRNAHSGYM